MSIKKQISKMDLQFYEMLRKDVSSFLSQCGKKYDKEGILLDIAPQVHEGALPYFKKAKVVTLDIDPKASATYTLDICQNNKSIIPDENFDYIVCTEVLEHVNDPFAAVSEIYRMLKQKGLLFVATPFNFRIHGPLPDYWRFTEHGLRLLLQKFKILKLKRLEAKNRWLMPIHYTVVAKK